MTHKTRAQVETELRDRLERAELMLERVNEDWDGIDSRLMRATLSHCLAARTALTLHTAEGGS